MSKVIVGMSGGVDSAVAAYLLKEQGYEVIGVTLRTWEASDEEENRCCEIDDARETAMKLGIQYHTFNCISEFRENVVKPFIHDYVNGFTPNPCVICNRCVKWEKMLYIAKVLKADYIATGHYAKLIRLDNGRVTVKTADDAKKDQTYMLYRLTQEQLGATLMPLGEYNKQTVREIAEKAGLMVASKPDSQEICFAPDGDYAGFIEKNSEEPIPGKGNFVDEDGNVLGIHKGIIHYTVGQRKGLGIAMGYPAYIKKICADTGDIVLTEKDKIRCQALICKDVNFLSIPGIEKDEKISCKVKVRYHHQGQEAIIESAGDKIKVTFTEPVACAAPGQSAVFYDKDDCVIGGGIIEEVKMGSDPE